MRFVFLAAFVAMILAPSTTWATPYRDINHAPITLMNGAKSSVTGSGATYDEAYTDARSKLPQGADEVTVRSKQENNVWYVTIYYN